MFEALPPNEQVALIVEQRRLKGVKDYGARWDILAADIRDGKFDWRKSKSFDDVMSQELEDHVDEALELLRWWAKRPLWGMA